MFLSRSMFGLRIGRSVVSATMAVLALCFACASASAQTAGSPARPVIGILGAIIQGAAKANVENSWSSVAPETRSCLDTALSPKNIGVEGLIRSGVKADDPRLSELMQFCQAVMTKQLRTNFPCTTMNDAGKSVETLCFEQFASRANGEMRSLDRDAFIRLAASGGGVEIATLEMPAARVARLQAAQQVALDRQRLANLKAEQDRKKANEEAQKELKSFRPY